MKMRIRAMLDSGRLDEHKLDAEALLREFGAVYTENPQALLDWIAEAWRLAPALEREPPDKQLK